MSAIKLLLLSPVTCGIYMLYWGSSEGGKILKDVQAKAGDPAEIKDYWPQKKHEDWSKQAAAPSAEPSAPGAFLSAKRASASTPTSTPCRSAEA